MTADSDRPNPTRASDGSERARTLAALAPRFATPRALSRPVTFWMINHPAGLTRDEVGRQLDEFRRQGVRTLVVYWAHLDVVPLYLKEPWRVLMTEICEEAREDRKSVV